MKKMILDNRRITNNTDNGGISFGTCQAIFTNVLGIKLSSGKIALKLHNFEQK